MKASCWQEERGLDGSPPEIRRNEHLRQRLWCRVSETESQVSAHGALTYLNRSRHPGGTTWTWNRFFPRRGEGTCHAGTCHCTLRQMPAPPLHHVLMMSLVVPNLQYFIIIIVCL